MSLNKLTRGIFIIPSLPSPHVISEIWLFAPVRFGDASTALDDGRWCTVTQSRKERRTTVKRKRRRRYRRVFRRYRIPYYVPAIRSWMRATMESYVQGWPRKIDFKRTWKLLQLLSSLLVLIKFTIPASISIELTTKIKKKKREIHVFYNNANNRKVDWFDDHPIRAIKKIFANGYLLRYLCSSFTLRSSGSPLFGDD